MKSSTIQIGNDSIAVYESEGKGQTALLIHGNSSSSEAFNAQLEGDPGKQHHLFAIDLPGHGKSSPASDPDATYNLFGYASLLKSVVDVLNLDDPVLVGHSLGGHIALEASEDISNVKGCFIFGTPPMGMPPAMEEAFFSNAADGLIVKGELTEEDMKNWAEALFKKGETASDPIPRNIRETDNRAREYLGIGLAAGKMKSELDIIARMSTPLAIIHGEKEQFINLDYIQGLSIPTLWKGSVQVILDCGHYPNIEKSAQFNALLNEFLGQV